MPVARLCRLTVTAGMKTAPQCLSVSLTVPQCPPEEIPRCGDCNALLVISAQHSSLPRPVSYKIPHYLRRRRVARAEEVARNNRRDAKLNNQGGRRASIGPRWDNEINYRCSRRNCSAATAMLARRRRWRYSGGNGCIFHRAAAAADTRWRRQAIKA